MKNRSIAAGSRPCRRRFRAARCGVSRVTTWLTLLLVIAATLGAAGFASPVLAKEKDGGPAPELLKDAIDPVNLGRERSLFLKAAGVDSELDEAEFNADQQKDNKSFVRSFEQWKTLKRFDADNNGKLDWFEANAYRRAIRGAIFVAYDADKDQRLTGAEREKANATLAKGKLPKLGKDGKGKPDAVSIDAKPPKQTRQAKGGPLTDEQREARRVNNRKREMDKILQPHDTNGDGVLQEHERLAALDKEEDFGKRMGLKMWSLMRFYDEDGDGKYSKKEHANVTMIEKQFEQWGKRLDARLWDTDGDGQVSQEERQVSGQRMQMIGAAVMAKAMKWGDTNGDGRVAPEEWRDMRERASDTVIAQFDKWIDDVDRDGDGKLNAVERQAWVEKFQGHLDNHMKESDKDGDGKLNNDEMVSLVERLAKEYGVAPQGRN